MLTPRTFCDPYGKPGLTGLSARTGDRCSKRVDASAKAVRYEEQNMIVEGVSVDRVSGCARNQCTKGVSATAFYNELSEVGDGGWNKLKDRG